MGAEQTREPDVGALLRRERQRRGRTLEELSRSTRIPPRVLAAIEEERHADLPSWPYVRGFLKTYAGHLGLDAPELVGRYAQARREAGHQSAAARLVPYPPARQFNWRDWTLPAALLVGALVFMLLRPLLPRPPESAPPPPDSSGLRSEPVAAPVREMAPEPLGPPVAQPEARNGRDEGEVRLLIRAEGATWVEFAADGAEVGRRELRPGENLALSARERLEVSLGDAGLLRLRWNERELGFVGVRGEARGGLLFVREEPRPATPSDAQD